MALTYKMLNYYQSVLPYKLQLPPPISKKAYNQHMKQVEILAVSNAKTLMCAAAERLRQLAFHKGEECVIEIDGQSVCKVAVSIDGTWQKRRHSSKIGEMFAVSVMTGEIIDCEVKSLICKECSFKEQ